MEILGIASYYGDRIFVPADVVRKLRLSGRIGLKDVGGRVAIAADGEQRRIDSNSRFRPPQWVVKQLRLKPGSKVIYLREDSGLVTISRLEDRVR